MMKTCNRCGCKALGFVMSYFNTEDICFTCKADEHHCPNYERAYDAETAAVMAKNYNFPGIGLAPEDRAVLAERLKLRKVSDGQKV